MYILQIPFSMYANSFKTCFTAFNYQTVLLLKRLIILVPFKMHEDYKIKYQTKINSSLDILHRTSNYPGYISALPRCI
jgi:hypothetical protein